MSRRRVTALLHAVIGLALAGAGWIQLAPGTHDDDHIEFVYSGTWNDDDECAGCYSGTQHWTEETGAAAETSFDGCGLEYHYPTNPFGGNADISIDDVFQEQVSQYSDPIVDDVSWTISGLADGVHTFQVEFPDDAGTNISLDYAIVLPCSDNGSMLDLWNALQQAAWISYGPPLLWALGLAIAGAVLLAIVTLIGRLLSEYIK